MGCTHILRGAVEPIGLNRLRWAGNMIAGVLCGPAQVANCAVSVVQHVGNLRKAAVLPNRVPACKLSWICWVYHAGGTMLRKSQVHACVCRQTIDTLWQAASGVWLLRAVHHLEKRENWTKFFMEIDWVTGDNETYRVWSAEFSAEYSIQYGVKAQLHLEAGNAYFKVSRCCLWLCTAWGAAR
jgi:hypothetical protein